MHGLVCDACGETLLLASDVRYVLRIEGFAAYDPLEITHQDLQQDLRVEMERLIQKLEGLSTAAAEDQVHRAFAFDLCPPCWSRYCVDPLEGLKARDGERRKKSQGN